MFGAALRTGSLNARLAGLAADAIHAEGAEADLAHIRDFEVPLYDGDTEKAHGVPAGALAFRDRLLTANGFVISSPEYNAAMPGVLKNLIDWVSRLKPQPFAKVPALLMSASPSMVGGNRGLWSLRVPLEHLGARVYPEMFSLAQAHHAFTEDGGFAEEELGRRFSDTIAGFLDLVEAEVHYPCAKHAWVEFLGEHVDPAIDRVQAS